MASLIRLRPREIHLLTLALVGVRRRTKRHPGVCSRTRSAESRWQSLAGAQQWQADSVRTRLRRPQLGRHRVLPRHHGNNRLFLRARCPLPPGPSPHPHSAPPASATAGSRRAGIDRGCVNTPKRRLVGVIALNFKGKTRLKSNLHAQN